MVKFTPDFNELPDTPNPSTSFVVHHLSPTKKTRTNKPYKAAIVKGFDGKLMKLSYFESQKELDKLKEGEMYTATGFKVRTTEERFRTPGCVDHAIVVDENSNLRAPKPEESFVDVPQPLPTVHTSVDELCDVYCLGRAPEDRTPLRVAFNGVVANVFPQQRMGGGSGCLLRQVTLFDENDEKISFTLFGESLNTVREQDITSKISLVDVTLKMYDGRPQLATNAQTKVAVAAIAPIAEEITPDTPSTKVGVVAEGTETPATAAPAPVAPVTTTSKRGQKK